MRFQRYFHLSPFENCLYYLQEEIQCKPKSSPKKTPKKRSLPNTPKLEKNLRQKHFQLELLHRRQRFFGHFSIKKWKVMMKMKMRRWKHQSKSHECFLRLIPIRETISFRKLSAWISPNHWFRNFCLGHEEARQRR